MTRTHNDAIVVGARCARFPGDTISGHAIQPAGVAYLKRRVPLDAVLATGYPQVMSIRIGVGDRLLSMPESQPASCRRAKPTATALCTSWTIE